MVFNGANCVALPPLFYAPTESGLSLVVRVEVRAAEVVHMGQRFLGVEPNMALSCPCCRLEYADSRHACLLHEIRGASKPAPAPRPRPVADAEIAPHPTRGRRRKPLHDRERVYRTEITIPAGKLSTRATSNGVADDIRHFCQSGRSGAPSKRDCHHRRLSRRHLRGGQIHAPCSSGMCFL